MPLDPSDMSILSRLLDQALDLESTQVEAWLAALPADHQRLVPTLRKMLAKHQAGEQAAVMADCQQVAGDADRAVGAATGVSASRHHWPGELTTHASRRFLLACVSCVLDAS